MFYLNNVQTKDAGSMEPTVSKDELKHEAIQDEFEFLIRDPEAIETAFNEGILIDAIACATWAQIADKRSPTFYESVAKRVEEGLRRKVWEFAEYNVRERSEP